MQLKSLRIFDAVCTTGSFSLAAERLHTVQSNVTAHIKKLEAELGVQLIERTAPMHATSAGRMLRGYAQQMLRAHDEALALLSGKAAAMGGLRIGAMETTAALRLPPLLAQLHHAHPGIHLELRTGPTAELLSELMGGHIDCAFVASHLPPTQTQWQAWKVFREQLVLVSGQPMADLPSAQTLTETPFLAFRQGCSYRQRIELLLASQGVTAARIMELGSLDAILGCVAAGMGYALLPRTVVEALQHRFAVHCLDLPAALSATVAEVPTYFVAAQHRAWSPAMHACASLLDLSAPCSVRAPSRDKSGRLELVGLPELATAG